MDRISRHDREICAQSRCAGRDDDRVAKTREHRLRAVQHVIQVLDQMCARNRCESSSEFAVRSGRVDEQYVEPEEAEERQKYQYDIGNGSSYMNGCAATCFFIRHFSSLLPYFTSFCAVVLKMIILRIPVMIRRMTERAPAIP